MQNRILINGLILFGLIFFAGCNFNNQQNHEGHNHAHMASSADQAVQATGNFGQEITKENALAVNDALAQITVDTTFELKLTGTISEVCQHSGCWLTIGLENGEELMVNMLDHAYEVPKDAAGKAVWAQGTAIRELIPVEMLKHYAADAGKSQEEIDAITQPEWKYTLDAKGVIIE
ncbi:MAG: DUF4920 domain-containing protein [Bacteroidales bacterium]|jgi:hypothetical protein|nr:DUF4920 domain-containing protein [Bacteroidales bacterium]